MQKKSIPIIEKMRSEIVIKKFFATKNCFICETDISYLTGIKCALSTSIIW